MAIKGGITLIQKLQKLFGARNVSDMMGRTTNVQTTAQGTNNPFARTFSPKYLAKNKDGVEEASKVILENMQFAFGNKNIQQMKNFEYNVNTLYNIKFPRTTTKKQADIIDIKTKSKVDDKGIMQLKDDLGLPEGVSPKSPMGKNLQELKKLDKEIELKGKQLDDDMDTSLKDVVEGMFGPLGRKASTDVMREGQRRAVIRQILLSDKNIKLPADKFDDLLYSRDLGKGTDAEDPLKLLDKYYERDTSKLDELDDIIDSTSSATEAADAFLKKGGFRLKGKTKTVEDFADEGDFDPGGMAQGGRAGFKGGGLLSPQMTDYMNNYSDQMTFEQYLQMMSNKKAKGGLAGQLHMNDGGRVGLEKGGPPNPGRRNFMKLMAGLASIPVLGKFFKLAKPAAKIAQLKNTTTTMPAWFPDFVDKITYSGVGKKIDADLMLYETKELPGIKVTKHDDGRVFVEGKNDYSKSYEIEYTPPGYEVVDYKTGKAVKTKGDFMAQEEVPVNVDPDGNADFDGEVLESVDNILSSDARAMEEFATGKKIKDMKSGEFEVGRAESLADAARKGEDLDDFAKGGLAGQLKL